MSGNLNKNTNQNRDPRGKKNKKMISKKGKPLQNKRSTNAQKLSENAAMDILYDNVDGQFVRKKKCNNWKNITTNTPSNPYGIRDDISAEEIFKQGDSKFKNEQSLNPVENYEFFHINYKVIQQHIQCIPFFERNELDPSIFSEKLTEQMKESAIKHNFKYGIGKFGKKMKTKKSNSVRMHTICGELRLH